MPYRFLTIAVVASCLFHAGGASATDVLSQDSQSYDLRVVMGDSEKTVFIAPNGDERSICPQKCVIYMPDGQNVEVGPNDIVFIIDGKISVYE